MYPPAVTSCQAARRTRTESAPSAKDRDAAAYRELRRGAPARSAVPAPSARVASARSRMLLRRHEIPPEPLARIRLGVDVLGVVRPADHHLDVPEQLVDVLSLLGGVEVRELLHARLDPVRTPLEPFVGGDRRLVRILLGELHAFEVGGDELLGRVG